MKTSHFLTISVLAFGWMSACSSAQSPELQSSPASPSFQATTVPTPALSPTPAQIPAQTPAVPVSPFKASAQDKGSDSDNAVAVIQGYYDALDRRDYEQAYRAWQSNGSASHQTFEAFKDGFAETTSTQVKISEPSQVEGAAGSQYIRVPVMLTATAKNQTVQHFKGTYVLRRSLVDGTSADDRTWHIYSAKLAQTD